MNVGSINSTNRSQKVNFGMNQKLGKNLAESLMGGPYDGGINAGLISKLKQTKEMLSSIPPLNKDVFVELESDCGDRFVLNLVDKDLKGEDKILTELIEGRGGNQVDLLKKEFSIETVKSRADELSQRHAKILAQMNNIKDLL